MSQLTLGPASTETTIYSRVRRLCKVAPTSPDSYTSDLTIQAYANAELQLLASECRSIKISNVGSEPTTVAGKRVYNLPSNCLELVDVYCGQSGGLIRLKQASTEYLYQNFGPSYTTRQGAVFYYYIDYDGTNNVYQIALAMVPNITGQLIQMFYILRPAIVANNTDVPQIDDRLDEALVTGVAARIMRDRRDPAFAQIYDAKRQEIVTKYNDSGRKSREPLMALNNTRSDTSYYIGD